MARQVARAVVALVLRIEHKHNLVLGPKMFMGRVHAHLWAESMVNDYMGLIHYSL